MHFNEAKLKLSVQSSSDHGIRSGSWQLVKEFNNNCKQTSNLTKFRSFALHKRNEKIYRKPHNTVKYGFRTARSISQTESKLWHQPRKSYSTDVFPLLSAFDLSDSALSINANDHGQAGYLNQLGSLTYLGSPTYM